MATPYFDPSTALPDPSTYAQHGPFGITMPSFLGTQAAANRRESVAPFLQRSGQEQELELQKQRQDVQEYTGEEAQAQRSAARRSATATSEQDILSAPAKGLWERSDWAKKTALNPLQTTEEKAKLTNLISEHENVPARHGLELMASQRDRMAKAKTPVEQAAIRDEVIRQWQQKYPDKQPPANLYNVNPQMYNHAYDAVVQTAQHLQNIQKEREVQAATTGREAMSQGGQTLRTQMNIDAGKTAAVRVAKIKSLLADPKTPASQKEALNQEHDVLQRQLIEDHLEKQMGKLDPTMLSVLGTKYSDAHATAINNARVQMLIARKVPVQMSDLRLISLGKSDEDIRKQAKIKGIQISD